MDRDIDPELPQPAAPVATPLLLPATKSGRVRKLPIRYQDFLPSSRSQIPHLPVVPEPPAEVAQGLVITCADDVTRRIFPRFFTYSADYPEKFVT